MCGGTTGIRCTASVLESGCEPREPGQHADAFARFARIANGTAPDWSTRCTNGNAAGGEAEGGAIRYNSLGVETRPSIGTDGLRVPIGTRRARESHLGHIELSTCESAHDGPIRVQDC
jgi:hypothetical protein